ncbi:MAG: carbohydrate kinase family protein, partial [Clostridia bacterium]|nr:carbohydrate kinase family protein [Clostridia bacterium]
MKILVSGLLNMETTTAVRGFPINYYPIDYSFFGVNSSPAGVAYNISLALNILGDEVRLCSMVGKDFTADYIKSSLEKAGISTDNVKHSLETTPTSVILYDPDGKRQIYCDLKDIQDRDYGFDSSMLDGVDIVVACNIN